MLKPNPKLVFDEETHSYFYERKRMQSVTTFLKRYNPPFDADKWSNHVAKKEGKTQEEIKAMWQQKGNESCRIGTLLHKYAECLILGKELPKLCSESEINRSLSIQQVLDDYVDYDVIAVEFPLVVPEWGLAGTIDLIIQHKETGVILMLDWKMGSKLNKLNSYGTKLLSPLAHLDDCELVKYSLQQRLYQRMFESQYPAEKFGDCILVWVMAQGYDWIHCLPLKEEVDIVLSDLAKSR